MSVRDAQGKNIGQIDDMIVDMNTGQVRYAMLRFDPGIMSGEKLFAVPTTQLKMPADRNDIVYNVDRARLEQAAVERSEWNERFLQDGERVARLDRAWGVRQPAQGAGAHRASDLIGKDVNSRSGESIGEIEELIVNMAQQKVHYAVMKFDQGWGSPERRYVLPLRSFELSRDKDDLVLNVDKSKLQSMKSFDQNLFSNLNDRNRLAEIDQYFVTVLPTVVTTSRTSSTSTTQHGHDHAFHGSRSAKQVFQPAGHRQERLAGP
jgi:sporulation protein YlmC with PRC-barrel domain